MKKYGFLLAFLIVIFQITLAGIPEKKELSPDGPYILHEQNSGIRLIRVNETGEIKDTVYKTIPADFSFPVVSEDGKHRFEVKLHSLGVTLFFYDVVLYWHGAELYFCAVL